MGRGAGAKVLLDRAEAQSQVSLGGTLQRIRYLGGEVASPQWADQAGPGQSEPRCAERCEAEWKHKFSRT